MKENHGERQKNGGFTDDQIEDIKNAILASIYEEIGRSIIKKALWVGGIVIATVLAWLTGAGHIRFPGATD